MSRSLLDTKELYNEPIRYMNYWNDPNGGNSTRNHKIIPCTLFKIAFETRIMNKTNYTYTIQDVL